jgi:DNA-binding NtrC family response regulator
VTDRLTDKIGSTATHQAPAAAPDRPGVLVVDDDPTIGVLLQIGLGQHGFRVFRALSGREACEVLRQHRLEIEVTLLDVRMPDLDGPQTLDALRRIKPQLRCCFMSGGIGGYTPEALYARGATHLFIKPFDLAQLVQALREVLSR